MPQDLRHPDEILKLLQILYRFGCPEIGLDKKTPVSFVNAFRSCGMPHVRSSAILTQADASRGVLAKALVSAQKGSTPPWEEIIRASDEYVPLITQILVSCQAQPELARLDQRLFFDWASGLEKSRVFFKSEAIVYDLVMTLNSNVFGSAGLAHDSCVAGDYTSSSRNFKKAASILQFLAEDQLPKWVVVANVKDQQLPSEATIGVDDALKTYFLGLGQQMAIATVLAKPDTPNYTLVAKLCLGAAELIEQFLATIRSRASNQMTRMDAELTTIATFQAAFQRLLSNYFLARSFWEAKEYGIGIYLINVAMSAIKSLPALSYAFKASRQDVSDIKAHMQKLLDSWEYDNTRIYFESVPKALPEDKSLKNGVIMMKTEAFTLPNVQPFTLGIPVQESKGFFKSVFGK